MSQRGARLLGVLAGLLMGLAAAALCVPAQAQAQSQPAQPTTFGPPRPGVAPVPAQSPGVGVLAPGAVLGEAGASGGDTTLDGLNPAAVLAGASRALPGAEGDGAKGLSTAVNILLVLTVITMVPSILLMTTCFLRMVIVLGLLKQALGTQQMPPSQVLLGLAMIMTLLVMSPTIDRINREAVAPYRAGQITDYERLWDKAKQPLRDFMFDQIEATGNYSGLYMVMNYRGLDTSRPETLKRSDVDMVTLVPAFVLSELKVAFLMGFKIYLPFLVIDMVISALLISMSMMMLPPVLISLPFKLLLFVMVDGWQLIVGGLLSSFVVRPAPPPVGPPAELAGASELIASAARIGEELARGVGWV
jgi:flagellar biosynthetic protein FliP